MPRKPKTKEATVLAVDCSKSMTELDSNDDKSHFDFVKKGLKNIIRQKIFAETKDEFLLVEFPTNKGSGIKANGHFRQPSVDLIKYISDNLNPIDNRLPTQIMDALFETIDLMVSERLVSFQSTAQLFHTSTIVFFTNLKNFHESDLKCFQNQIHSKLKQHTIHLIIVSPFNSEVETSESPKVVIDLINYIKEHKLGNCFDFETVIEHFDLFQVYKTSPFAWYSTIELGKDLNVIKIPIGAFIKAAPYARKRGKTTTFNPDSANPSSSLQSVAGPSVPAKAYLNSQISGSQFAKLSKLPEEKKEYGFKYGDTIVPFSDEDKALFEYNKLEKGIKIIGFTSAANVNYTQRRAKKTYYMFADPRPAKKNHKRVFQTMVKAMIESKRVAIVRYGYSDRTAPQIGFLMPLVEDNKLLLVYHKLPFADDVREVSFPLLFTKSLTPTESQLQAIDDLMDSMDLMNVETEEDDTPGEALINSQIPDPSLQFFFDLLYKRRLYGDKVGLKKMPKRLRNSIEVPEEIAEKAELVLEEILDEFKLVEPKTSKKSHSKNSNDSQVSAKRPKVELKLDINAIKSQITNSIKSGSNFGQIADKFNQSLKTLFEKYCEELSEEITGLVEMFRKESVANNDPKHFNDFMLNYVNSFRGKDVWFALLSKEIKPIADTECPNSATTQQIVDEFITLSDDSFEEE